MMGIDFSLQAVWLCVLAAVVGLAQGDTNCPSREAVPPSSGVAGSPHWPPAGYQCSAGGGSCVSDQACCNYCPRSG